MLAKESSPADPPGSCLSTRAQHLITSVYALMEGSLEQSKFEDDCRDMFGISSYILFTIDKLIVQLAKQVRALRRHQHWSPPSTPVSTLRQQLTIIVSLVCL